MIARDLDYDFPDAAFLLIATLGWVALFLALEGYRQKRLQQLAPSSLWEALLNSRADVFTWVKAGCLILAWIFACTALMEPKAHARYIHAGQSHETLLREPPRSVIFLIDASASMGITDTRLKISRLEDAKGIADAIISQLGSGANAAVYAFTSALTKLSPPTPDQLFTRLMLKSIRINEGDIPGTNYLNTFKALHNLFLSQSSDMQYTLILLSDGGDTTVESLQGPQKEAAMSAILDQLKMSPGVNLRVFTIGNGSKEGGTVPGITFEGHEVHSDLNSALLEQISKAGRGKSYLSNDYTPLTLAQEIVREIMQTPASSNVISPTSQEDKEAGLTYDVYFQYPLALALLFLGLGILWPEAWLRRAGE